MTEKTIRKIVDPEKQDTETLRYWQSLPVGDRLTAVWEASEAAYSFAAAFRRESTHDAAGSQRAIKRIQRSGR